MQDTLSSVIAHELGHNFGLGHASAVQCDASAEYAPCRTVAYWDLYDVMGVSWDQVGSLNAPHAARLGFLPPSAQQTVSASEPGGTVTVTPMGSRSGIRVLALTAGNGKRYWVEYRAPAGRDAWLADPAASYGLLPGVLVRTDGAGPRSDSSLLLDGTPSAQAQWDGDEQTVLSVGRSLTIGDLSIRVSGATATAATISVEPGLSTPPTDSPITVRHRSLGGDAGRIGPPLESERCLPDGGCVRRFANGQIAWSPATGARVVEGAVLDAWERAGGPGSWLGYPVSDTACGLVRGGCAQQFQGGSVYWSPGTGARPVSGGIRGYWAGTGWEWGWLGYPRTDMRCDGGACSQYFEGGVVTWSPATGTRGTGGAIADRWALLGSGSGVLGLPTAEMVCGLPRGGCGQQFQGGSVYWSPGTGAQAVSGAIRGYWTGQGWERGPLGYPRAEMTCAGGTCSQEFEGGAVVWSGSTGTHAVSGAIRARWLVQLYEVGPPTTGMWCGMVRGGCGQHFANASSIYWSPATGALAVGGAIRGAWAAQGWETGRLGYPVAAMTCAAECSQAFEGGSVTWSPRAGTQVAHRR